MIRLLFVVFLSSLPVAQANLIGLWKFDEPSGNSASDNIGGNSASWVPGTQPAPNWTPTGGLIGGAIDLPGSGSHRDYFFVPSLGELNGTPAGMTISMWILPHNTSSYKGLMMSRGVTDDVNGGASGQNYGLAREDAHADGRISGASVDSPSNSIPPNAGWQHVVWVWDNSAGTQKIIINGVQSGPTQSSNEHPANLSITGNTDWRIGDDACCSNRLFNGLIDDVAVWDEALEVGQIGVIYQNGLAGYSADQSPAPPETLPLEAGVLINEIHYDPDPKTEFVEYLELLNTNSSAVDVSGWSFAQGFDFTFPPNTVLEPLEYVLLSENPAALQSKFFPNPADAPRIFQYTGSLENDGESVELQDTSFVRIDKVDYRAEFPWPISPNGDGASMQLVNATLDNDLAGSWRPALPNPGIGNSVFADNAAPQIRQVGHSPQMPVSNAPVTVTAKITDPDGVASVNLLYQTVAPGDFLPAYSPLDRDTLMNQPGTPLAPNPDFEDPTNWTTTTMLDDGTGNDLLAGDGIFTGTIPGQVNRTLIRYRIETTDSAAIPESIRVPYDDDPSLNFACFVYDGVPDWTAADSSVHPDGPGHAYSSALLTSLPVYTMITRDADRRQAYAYESTGDQAWQIPKANVSARKIYNWECALVYDGVVYDHVGYRLRQRNNRYSRNGKRSMRYRLNRGHYFQARDEAGKKYDYKWSRFSTSMMASFNSSTTYGLYETMNSKLWRMSGVECPTFLPAHLRMIDGAEEAPAGTDGQYLGDFFGFATIVEDIDGILLDNRKLPKGNMYKLKDGVFDGNEIQRYQSREAVTDASDFDNIMSNLNPSQDETWLRNHVDWDQWTRYHAVVEAVRHYDYGTPSTHLKNRAWYFKPSTGSPFGQLRIIPHDHDASWSKGYHDSLNDVGNSIGTGFPWYAAFGGITRPATGPEKDNLTRDYRNYIRHFRDLLWQEDTVETMIDSHIASISEFSLADRDRWVGGPAEAGTETMEPIENRGTSMKDMAFTSDTMYGANLPGGRAAFLDQIAADSDIPDTPAITYTGAPEHPTGLLSFQSSTFNDPQGIGTFGAMEWRIAEVEAPAPPAPDPIVLLPWGSEWSYLDDGSDQGSAWTDPLFNDSGWAFGPAELGYGDGDEATVVSYGSNSSDKFRTTYFRKTFTLTDVTQLGDLKLQIKRDDGAIVHLNGNPVYWSNLPTNGTTYLTLATKASDNGDTAQTAVLPASLFLEGTNTLAVEIHQSSDSSSDITFDFQLETAPETPPLAADPAYEWLATWESGSIAGFQSTIAPPALATREGLSYRARVRHQDNSGRWSHWSAPYEFVAGAADAGIYQQSLVISEVMYHPEPPSFDELSAGYDDDDFFEYLEIQNVGSQALDLSDIRFTKGIDFDFADSGLTVLEPGGFALVVANQGAFEMRHATGLPIAGEFASGKLSNSGENIKLSFGAGIAIQEFVYSDVSPWPTSPDGTGPSLVLNNPWAFPDHGLAASWRPSSSNSGSPGADDLIQFTGDPDADDDQDGINALLEFAFGTSDSQANASPFTIALESNGDLSITLSVNLLAGNISTALEVSNDLSNWQNAGPEFEITDQVDHLDGTATITITVAAPLPPSPQFIRYAVSLVP